MSDDDKINLFLEDEENNKSASFDSDFPISTNKKQRIVQQAESDDGGDGDSSGGITLSVEQLNAYLLACFTKERRQGQKKFGSVPFTEDPNRLLGKKVRQREGSCCELPLAHPLLAHSQQFSGDDPKITANPIENPNARERFPELRNENQLRKNPGLGRRKSVTLSR
ncbi:MAG: hypothetical protein V4700_05220 [Pseudomonadota bacterium]